VLPRKNLAFCAKAFSTYDTFILIFLLQAPKMHAILILSIARSECTPVQLLSDQTRIVATKDQVSCDLAGEAAILNLKNGVYYGLDPVGARIWNLIQEPKTLAQIRETILAEYDVEPDRLNADLHSLLAQLADQQLIEFL
jgi:hypothetical protein